MNEVIVQDLVNEFVMALKLGTVVSNEVIDKLSLVDAKYFWKRYLEARSACSELSEDIISNANDIYNIQLIYWSLNNQSVSDSKRHSFYDSLINYKTMR